MRKAPLYLKCSESPGRPSPISANLSPSRHDILWLASIAATTSRTFSGKNVLTLALMGLRPHELFRLGGRHGFSEQVSLDKIAPRLGKQIKLFLLFHPFGNHFEP